MEFPVTPTAPPRNHGAGHDAPDPAETESDLEAHTEKESGQSKGKKLSSDQIESGQSKGKKLSSILNGLIRGSLEEKWEFKKLCAI